MSVGLGGLWSESGGLAQRRAPRSMMMIKKKDSHVLSVGSIAAQVGSKLSLHTVTVGCCIGAANQHRDKKESFDSRKLPTEQLFFVVQELLTGLGGVFDVLALDNLQAAKGGQRANQHRGKKRQARTASTGHAS